MHTLTYQIEGTSFALLHKKLGGKGDKSDKSDSSNNSSNNVTELAAVLDSMSLALLQAAAYI